MTGSEGEERLSESAAIERLWYIPPVRQSDRGWLVYTLNFVLATLQGRITEPFRTKRTAGWLLIGTLVRGFMALAQVIITVLAWLPLFSSFIETVARVYSRNATGFFLRACYWKAKLRHLGQDTIIDQYVDIWGAGAVSIGSHCHIDTNVRLAAGERRHGQHGSIDIGDFVHLGPGTHIAGRGGVRIGNCVGVMANAHVYSATGVIEHPDDPGRLMTMSHMAPPEQQHAIEAPIRIDDHALIGMMARVMPGVHVGRGAIVHGLAELTRDVPPFANIGALPRGRQIGWRKPRRPSPILRPTKATADDASGAETDPLTGVRIREVRDSVDWGAIEGVTALHFDAFVGGVTTQLGIDFVNGYYIAMIEDDDCSLWIAELNGRVVGFLGCTIDRRRFEAANRSGTTRLLAVWRFFTLRLGPIAILRAMKKHRLSRPFSDNAELLSIVVDPSARRLGLGKRFLSAWMKKLRDSTIPSFLVFTDNPEGIKFYEKYGGECLFKFEMRSLWSACYRFRAEQDEGLANEAEATQGQQPLCAHDPIPDERLG